MKESLFTYEPSQDPSHSVLYMASPAEREIGGAKWSDLLIGDVIIVGASEP